MTNPKFIYLEELSPHSSHKAIKEQYEGKIFKVLSAAGFPVTLIIDGPSGGPESIFGPEMGTKIIPLTECSYHPGSFYLAEHGAICDQCLSEKES